MKASVLIGTIGLTGLAIGLGQWSASVIGDETPRTPRVTSPDLTPRVTPQTVVTGPQTEGESDVVLEDSSLAEVGGFSEGADIMYSDIYQANTYGPIGGVYGYSLGSKTCNVGDEFLVWINNGSPGFASNAYRIHDGRLLQIGTGWVKHACCVSNFTDPVCGGLECQNTGDPGLRPGCRDAYSASWNAIQNRLGPRIKIDPWAADFAPLITGSFNSIERRLQIHRDEMDLDNYPGALYFVEGVYVCTSSTQAGNIYNNATYRRVTFNQTSFNMSLAPQQSVGSPGIFAWKEHGLGVNSPDPDVSIVTLDLPNEGRFFSARKVSDNGDGTWRYEYAVYNLNSNQAAGSFSVELGEGANVTNVGFHAPTFHSDSPQDNTPWEHTIEEGAITWNTAHTYDENPNANAIRWGSMYNFWFDADQPPVNRNAEIGVFIPGHDTGVSFTTLGPDDAVLPCLGDLNDDDAVDGADLLVLLGAWGSNPGHPADFNSDDSVDGADLLILLSEWGDCP